VRSVVVDEFGAGDVVIVSNMDFGHTDPQWILPLGIPAELDPGAATFRLLEPAVE
jgi:muramoyltetrapeptide carboxypeptidase LdcA involved in peptidoglycan recycling